MSWKLVYTKQAQKDSKKIASSLLKPMAKHLLEIIKKNPFQTPPLMRNWWEIYPVPIQDESTFNTDWSTRCLKK